MKRSTIAVFDTLTLSDCAADVMARKAPAAGDNFRVAVLPFKPPPCRPAVLELDYEAFSTQILQIKNYSVVPGAQ